VNYDNNDQSKLNIRHVQMLSTTEIHGCAFNDKETRLAFLKSEEDSQNRILHIYDQLGSSLDSTWIVRTVYALTSLAKYIYSVIFHPFRSDLLLVSTTSSGNKIADGIITVFLVYIKDNGTGLSITVIGIILNFPYTTDLSRTTAYLITGRSRFTPPTHMEIMRPMLFSPCGKYVCSNSFERTSMYSTVLPADKHAPHDTRQFRPTILVLHGPYDDNYFSGNYISYPNIFRLRCLGSWICLDHRVFDEFQAYQASQHLFYRRRRICIAPLNINRIHFVWPDSSAVMQNGGDIDDEVRLLVFPGWGNGRYWLIHTGIKSNDLLGDTDKWFDVSEELGKGGSQEDEIVWEKNLEDLNPPAESTEETPISNPQ
jgi:hypothetical protein